METGTKSWLATLPSVTRIILGNMEIDRGRFEVRIRGRRIGLTFMEFELLSHLARNRGNVLSKERLLEAAARRRGGGGTALRIHISRLRKKIVESSPWIIRTVQKRGYVLTDSALARQPTDERGLVPSLST